MNILPNNIKTCDFMSSPFQNSQTETILRNLIIMQKSKKNNWFSFSWDDYKAFCTHNVTSSEKRILDTLSEGGKPHLTSSARINSGWLLFNDNKYSFSEKMINMLYEKYGI